MKKAANLNILGIKCDNKECDYVDKDVKAEEYDKWLNKPCPVCGENLLTQKDYDNIKFLTALTNTINKIFPKPKEDEEGIALSVEMDGSGNMTFKQKE